MLLTYRRTTKNYSRSQNNTKIIASQAALKAQSNIFLTQLMSEIKIHKSLSHKNVVKFLHNFEDNLNVYMVLELCPNKV